MYGNTFRSFYKLNHPSFPCFFFFCSLRGCGWGVVVVALSRSLTQRMPADAYVFEARVVRDEGRGTRTCLTHACMCMHAHTHKKGAHHKLFRRLISSLASRFSAISHISFRYQLFEFHDSHRTRTDTHALLLPFTHSLCHSLASFHLCVFFHARARQLPSGHPRLLPFALEAAADAEALRSLLRRREAAILDRIQAVTSASATAATTTPKKGVADLKAQEKALRPGHKPDFSLEALEEALRETREQCESVLETERHIKRIAKRLCPPLLLPSPSQLRPF